MARVELPGGQWAELTEPSRMKPQDRLVVQKAVKLAVRADEAGGDGHTEMDSGLTTNMQVALLQRVITSWSLPFPLPPTRDLLLNGPPDDDTWLDTFDALAEAIEPHLERVRVRPNRRTRTGSSGS